MALRSTQSASPHFRLAPPAAQNPMNYPGSTSGLNPNYLNALQHQEYLTAAAQRLGELQATAGLVDPLALEGTFAP